MCVELKKKNSPDIYPSIRISLEFVYSHFKLIDWLMGIDIFRDMVLIGEDGWPLCLWVESLKVN